MKQLLDAGAHFGLMTKVCTCIKQLLHSYNSHVVVET